MDERTHGSLCECCTWVREEVFSMLLGVLVS